MDSASLSHQPVTKQLAEAGWFPADLHVPQRQFTMLRIAQDVLERSVFLDTRIEADIETGQPLNADAICVQQPERLGWLFHTSFCASTLLARALHDPPRCMVLKEPLVLRRLADARHSRWAVPFDDLIEKSAWLLGRPWQVGGSVVVKPTHAALNMATDLMAHTSQSHAIVLTSSLRDFLISNIKKTAETQAKIGVLAERALGACSLHERLSATALSPPDMLCAAAVQWAAQREVVAELLQAVGPQRVRILDMQDLEADLLSAVTQVATWLGVDIDPDRLRTRVRQVQTRNAKAVTVDYDFAQRNRDAEQLTAHFAPQIEHALRWHERHLAGAMRTDALEPQPGSRLMQR